MSEENTDSAGTVEVPEEVDAQEVDGWVNQLSHYFTKNMLDNFFTKDNLTQIRIGSIRGKGLADAVIAGLLKKVQSYRAGRPAFDIVGEETDNILSPGAYDIFVRKT